MRCGVDRVLLRPITELCHVSNWNSRATLLFRPLLCLLLPAERPQRRATKGPNDRKGEQTKGRFPPKTSAALLELTVFMLISFTDSFIHHFMLISELCYTTRERTRGGRRRRRRAIYELIA